MNKPESRPEQTEQEHGEGNYKAGRQYQDAVKRTAGTKRSQRAAREAKEAMDDPESRAELEQAADEAKRKANKDRS